MKNRENAKYVKLGATGAAVVAFGLIFFFILYRADGFSSAFGVLLRILRPFVYGAVIAYLVTPLANWLSKRFGKPDGSSGLANVLALLIALVIVCAIILLIVPQLVKSVVSIAQALPGQLAQLQTRVEQMLADDPALKEKFDLVMTKVNEKANDIMNGDYSALMGGAVGIASGAVSTLAGFFGVLKDLFIGVIVALYFLSKRAQLAAQATLIVRGALKQEWADWVENEVRFADRMFNGFFMGKLLDSAIVGAICFAGCLVMGFGSPLLIAVIVGVTNIIPFFGPFIGAVPCALLLLLESPVHCLMFLVFVVVLQQLDGNVIGPKILGDSTGLSALWVMFGILLFGGLWGIMGMLVGVPLMAIIYDVVRQLTYKGVRKNGKDDMIDGYNARFHPPAPPKGRKGQASAKRGN